MYLLLTLSLSVLAFTVQPSKSVDSTRIAQLRAQLRGQIQQAAKVQAQKMDSIEKVVTELQSSLRFYERTGSLAVIVLGLVGISSIIGFIKRSAKKFEKAIDDAIYRIDPKDMPIKIPETGMEKQIDRLQRLEFRNLSTYRWLDESCMRHAVIFSPAKDEQAEELKRFISDKKLGERDDVAFIVFTHGMPIKPTIFAGIENVTFTNTPLTLVQQLFVAARGIVRKAK